MAKALKVYTWSGFRNGKQTQEIVAAYTGVEVCKLTGVKRTGQLFNFGLTGNQEDIALATSKPAVVFYKGTNAKYDDPWIEAPR